MDKTEHKNLRLPQYPDPADIMEINRNFDDIDAWAEQTDAEIATRLKKSELDVRIPSTVTFDTLHSSGWHVQNGIAVSARTMNNVMLADLQAIINSLPKYLDRNVTINMAASPGADLTSTITISGFSGSGQLNILGPSSIGATCSVGSITVNNCSNSRITVRGFRATNTGAETTSFYIVDCTAMVEFIYCSSIAGSNATVNLRGCYCVRSTAQLSESQISNKSAAIATAHGIIRSINNSGTGNAIGYYAYNGIVQIMSGTVAGTSVVTVGGLIVGTAGATL